MDTISHPLTETPLSQNIQMYLVIIARLEVDDTPVRLPLLAQELSYSVVSVNEMCRKLQDQGLLSYEPYKGVRLTPDGQRRANYILRRHRLWEVFLVDKLGFPFEQAHEAACLLEHSTPDPVADRLDLYMGHPVVNPLGQPIPSPEGELIRQRALPLAKLAIGHSACVVGCQVETQAQSYLESEGLRPGAEVTLLSATSDALLIKLGERLMPIAAALADSVLVTPLSD